MPSVIRSLPVVDDPLTLAMRPPPDETPAERELRLKDERDAKAISAQIDTELDAEREIIKQTKKSTYKLLLLGQSDSGKSTLLRQFQLMFDPERLEQDRPSWLPVIHLNVIRTTRLILEALEWKHESDDAIRHSVDGRNPNGYSSDEYSEPSTPSTISFDALPTLRMSLGPLLSMESVLAKRLGTDVQVGGKNMVFAKNGWQNVVRRPSKPEVPPPDLASSDGDSFDSSTASGGSMSSMGMPTSPRRRGRNSRGAYDVEVDMDLETSRILEACKREILTLWGHPWLPDLLKKRRFQLEESSGFFMSQLNRIAQPGYVPDNNDILRARLRTMGIVEHVFRVQVPPNNRYLNWKLFDVGGSRGQRASWVPYFEDAKAIIYLAPISSFDQYLEEDARCNRVEDSLQLFKYICGHPLLKNVHLVLFLNKIDVLKKKLDSGIRVTRYITSYGDRPNDVQSVCTYFRSHFQQIHKKATTEENGEQTRALYCHYTTVIDIVATRKIIGDVRDAITRTHLKDSVIL